MTWVNWIILGCVLCVIETFTPTFFIMLFGIGAFCAAIASYFGLGISLQLLIFVIVSLFLVIFIRRIYIKYFIKNTVQESNVNRLIGKTGKVIQEVTNDSMSGRVKIDGEVWIAKSEQSKVIEKDSDVKILAIEGTKLIVNKEEIL